ncbi:MAG: hypothetical protein PWP31_2045 [Clostridia bacterium]|nr:hypothetical protein [Clostridia bacterium]
MSNNIDNKLWESHRIVLPKMREKRRVSKKIHALEIIRLIGREKLLKLICNNPEAQACGFFLKRI